MVRFSFVPGDHCRYHAQSIERPAISIKVLKIVLTFIFGNPETRLATAICLASLPMLNAPWWQPFLAAVLQTYTRIDTTGLENFDQKLFWGGWILLSIGLLLYLRVGAKAFNDLRRDVDLCTLRKLFCEFNTTQMAIFLEEARSNIIPAPTTFYWEGFKSRYQAPITQFNARKLRNLVRNFFDGWFAAMNSTVDAMLLPDFKTVKLKVNPADRENALDRIELFQQSVTATDTAFRKLIAHLKYKYPDFDIEETDAIAYKAYVDDQED